MPKDIHCLRDIWYSIDRDAAIAQRSDETLTAQGHSLAQYKKSIEKKRAATCVEALQWQANHPHANLPRKKEHFLKGLNLQTGMPHSGPGSRRF